MTSDVPPSLVELELARVVENFRSRGATKLADLLEYIVRQTLVGVVHDQKSLSDAFFPDPAIDGKLYLRNTVKRLRDALARYYQHGPGKDSHTVIDLPPNTYSPSFHSRLQPQPAASPDIQPAPQDFPFDVLIAYAPEDKAFATTLAEHLRDDGLHVWFDSWALAPGEDRLHKTRAALPSARHLLLLLSQHTRNHWPDFQSLVTTTLHSTGQHFVPMLLNGSPSYPDLSHIVPVNYSDSNPLRHAQLLTALKAVILPRRNPAFFNRDLDLAKISARLKNSGRAVIAQAKSPSVAGGIVLSGLGGIGKTQLAIEYAHSHRHLYSNIFFLHADNLQKLEVDFDQIQERFLLPRRFSDTSRAQSVLRWLDQTSGWLLIFDNVDNPRDIAPFVPQCEHGHILFTSRLTDLTGIGIDTHQPIEINRWTPEDSRNFLLNQTALSVSDEREADALEQILVAVDGLPLALAHIAANLKQHGPHRSFQHYWNRFNQLRLKLFLDEQSSPYPAGSHEALIFRRQNTVTTTWHINFEQVQREAAGSPETPESAAPDILLAAAFLSPDDIEIDLFRKGAAALGPRFVQSVSSPTGDTENIVQALRLLSKYSLIESRDNTRLFSMHRLVQESIRRWFLSDAERAEWAVRVIGLLKHSTNLLRVRYGDWPSAIHAVPHGQFIASILLDDWKKDHFTFLEAADLLMQTGFMLTNLKEFGKAMPLLNRSLEIYAQVLGPEHLKTAWAHNYIGDNLSDNFGPRVAIGHYQKALEIFKHSCGPVSDEVAQAYNNLGIAQYNLSDYSKAVSAYESARAIWEELHNSANVGSVNHNLARIFVAQGAPAKAEEHFRLAIRQISLPHMSARAQLALAEFLESQDRHQDAGPHFRKALDDAKSAFGHDSPQLLPFVDRMQRYAKHHGSKREQQQLDSMKQSILQKNRIESE